MTADGIQKNEGNRCSRSLFACHSSTPASRQSESASRIHINFDNVAKLGAGIGANGRSVWTSTANRSARFKQDSTHGSLELLLLQQGQGCFEKVVSHWLINQ
jgi:hypothetical protein